MLKTLRIRDLAIIEDLTVEFGPGLNLLTGETGAGKSIVVDALGLAGGDRADAKLVRSGTERAVVDAVFSLAPGSAIPALLRDKGVDVVDEELVVRREVAAEGGGRVFINGSPCALAVLREVGGLLVDLHGQHEHQSLLSLDRHLELLDRFAGLEALVSRVAEGHGEVVSVAEARDRLESRRAQSEERAELLRRQIREIDAVGPRPDEFERLESERKLLRNAGRVAEILEALVCALYDGEPSAAALAGAASRHASELAEIDPSLEELARRIDAARIELADAGAALRDYRDRAEFDPARLEIVESRLAALTNLRLRYGADEKAVLRHREELRRELDSLESLDGELTRLAEALRKAEACYREAAKELSRARRDAARRLAPAVEEQLAALALARARFEISFAPARGTALEPTDGEPIPLSPRGAERAEFLLAANPGEPSRALAKVVSGGELSRIMLALHAVLEGAGAGRVLVFDEVDAGIGGAVADAVGSRLARLARRNQVLCVTHLPQVAAHGDRHYYVRKRIVGGRTVAGVEALDGDKRIDELARMLGGRSATEASRRNAADLLAAARAGGRGKK